MMQDRSMRPPEHSSDTLDCRQGQGVECSPSLKTIEELTRLWQRILQRSPIGIEENFFDLGGNPSLAAELFSEIADAFGRELSPLTITQAPTIHALARLLEKSSAASIPPLLLLRPGHAAPPVFITHGIGSSVMDLFDLISHVQTTHPIYGMQARGMDGVEEPLDNIEDMAEYFLAAVRKIQPRGPYILVGYSLGGLVTLEMAGRLAEKGEKIALLALLETYPHRRYMPLGTRVQLYVHLARHHASKITKLPPYRALRYLLASKHRTTSGGHGSSKAIGLRVSAARRVYEKSNAALMRYRPRRYSGPIRFVKSAISLRFPENPAAVWAYLLPQLEIEIVPGDHQGIITEKFESLAAVLSRYLREAFAEEQR
jgi:acetoacetyl-CoA synthetase